MAVSRMCRQVLLDENVRTLFFDQRYGKEYRLDAVQEIFPPVDHESQVNWIMSKKYRHLKQFINVSGEDSLRGMVTFELNLMLVLLHRLIPPCLFQPPSHGGASQFMILTLIQ